MKSHYHMCSWRRWRCGSQHFYRAHCGPTHKRHGGRTPPPPLHMLSVMGILHNVFFRGEIGLTYVLPKLTRAGIVQWKDLLLGGMVKLEYLEVVAYTWKMVYDMGVQDVCISSQAPEESRGPSMDQWGAQWGQRCTLLFMQRRHAEEPRQEA